MTRVGLPSRALVAAIVAGAVLRLVMAASLPLTDDEAYYRLWALVPALSYFDHPPMAAWMMAAGRWIAGDTAFGIRLAAPLVSLLGPFILWRTAAILFDRTTAERATWVALAMPLLAVGGIIITPDTPSVLFWGLAAWTLAELQHSQNANWWLAVGVFSGLGLLSKYTNLFFGAGIVLWLCCVPANRHWFRAWQLWAGGVLAALLTLPVLAWNKAHDWASFKKQFGRVVPTDGPTIDFLGEFAGAFVGLASPVIAVLAVYGLWLALSDARKTRDQAQMMLATGIVPLLAYLLVHAITERAQPNWAAPVYPALAICAVLGLAAIADRQLQRRVWTAALGIGFFFWGAIYLHAWHPIVRAELLADPTGQMRGWPALAADIERLRLEHGARWIATSSYATTGQLAFALKAQAPVQQLTQRVRYAHLPTPDDALLASPALYVELERRQTPALLSERFSSVSALGTLVRHDGGVEIATYVVYRVAGPLGAVLSP